MHIRDDAIKLADGSTWGITAGDEQAAFIVSHLVKAMQLGRIHEPARRLIVRTDNHSATPAMSDGVFDWTILPSESEDTVVCLIGPANNGNALALQLKRLSLTICLQAQNHRGVLLHGALAEWKGNGIILAGPWGIGKTTASQRLESPWRSLCDDLTLVVRDKQGTYWAHPWPTWSRFVSGGPGGAWDVQHAVPLKSIFFLVQAHAELVESVGEGQAACLLVESAEQAWWELYRSIREDERRTFRVQRFTSICTMAQIVPTYLLHLSLTGSFWQEIEKVIVPD